MAQKQDDFPYQFKAWQVRPVTINENPKQNNLRNEYANHLLQYVWHGYHTQTFRNTRHDSTNAALSLWNTLSSKLRWTRGFITAESHRLGGIHLHALLANDYDYNSWQLRATQNYTTKAYGYSKTESAINQATVNLYVAKYVTKDSGDYYYLGNTWEGPFWSSNAIV